MPEQAFSLRHPGWGREHSEVVLPLFEDLSPAELAAKLDGMFGVVAASADGKDFVAVRDPVGIKPLYRGWSRDGGRVIFASELKCLVGVVEHAELVPPGHVWWWFWDAGRLLRSNFCLLRGFCDARGLLRSSLC